MYLFYVRVHCSCLQTHPKRASDPITDGCEPPCGCWELNSGPLEKQSVLLTTEPPLQPISMFLNVTVCPSALVSCLTLVCRFMGLIPSVGRAMTLSGRGILPSVLLKRVGKRLCGASVFV